MLRKGDLIRNGWYIGLFRVTRNICPNKGIYKAEGQFVEAKNLDHDETVLILEKDFHEWEKVEK